MKIIIERRTTVVTSYEIDLSKLDIADFKQALIDNDHRWIAESFSTPNELRDFIASNSDAASEIFNVCNSYSKFGDRNEYFLDGEEYSFN